MTQPDLSGKLYFTISEVSEICGVKPHVLRYWESEFPTLRPRKNRGGSRRYRRADIDEVMVIKTLLLEEGYRIAGARKLLAQRRRASEDTSADTPQLAIPFAQLAPAAQIAQLQAELAEILALLRELGPARTRQARG
ncbi:MAG: MerR family transcriptional regulator [Candidatus Krumholzibacteria bacterium]|nr:MerR family transcriptional regulator [Candidatus Krumholzibacteria bacterium]